MILRESLRVLLVLVIMISIFALSLTQGAGSADATTLLEVLNGFDPRNTDHLVMRDLRVPRALAAMMVGAALGVAGALMQGVTRNPLASPTLMGLNAGAGLGLACTLVIAPGASFVALIVSAFLGAGIGVGLSLGLGLAAGGASAPLRLALAGAAVSALLGAIGSGVVIVGEIAQDVLFFTAGGVQGVGWDELGLAAPWIVIGLLIALLSSPAVSLLSLGEDVAAALGARVILTRSVAAVATLLLAGAAVAIAGQVGFIGLAAPHLARFIVGQDYRRIIPMAGLIGATLLVGADLAARTLNPPHETPVSLLTALIGAPVLIWIARRSARVL
ncbi:iron ABC transporter permease [Vreelandella andesensis]|uniref:Iron ABC transporter permease n=1 Tax=Vreelandella andesensis TaxID=447567 RepID=A0A3S0W5C1_9GAMM|nr:iron ABC transporter permease [Halomonas andesensis]RUR32100.1 iron ABC transporter permease [Halomonas andesensis]